MYQQWKFSFRNWDLQGYRRRAFQHSALDWSNAHVETPITPILERWEITHNPQPQGEEISSIEVVMVVVHGVKHFRELVGEIEISRAHEKRD